MSFESAMYESLYHLDVKPPTVVHIDGETTVLENSHATYKCSADGHPEPKKM